MMDNFQGESNLCGCVCEHSVTYLCLEFKCEDVLPSRGVLGIQSQRLELCVYEEQSEKGSTHTHTHTLSMQ